MLDDEKEEENDSEVDELDVGGSGRLGRGWSVGRRRRGAGRAKSRDPSTVVPRHDYGVVRLVKKRRTPSGEVWVNEYKRVGKLGQGSYGQVFKVSAPLSF